MGRYLRTAWQVDWSPPHSLSTSSTAGVAHGRLSQPSDGSSLVNLLCFLLDLGLISVLQIFTGFPESQILPYVGRRGHADERQAGNTAGEERGKKRAGSAEAKSVPAAQGASPVCKTGQSRL